MVEEKSLLDISADGINYPDYRKMIDELLARDMTTGSNHSEDYLNYTRMNVHRMDRADKRYDIRPDLALAANTLNKAYTFLVLTEGWCGDAAHNVPLIAKLADSSPQLDLKLILRDEHLDVMDAFLTNGGRSIPKLIALDNATGKVVSTWGPRPEPIQQKMMDYKADTSPDKLPYSEMSKEVQLWYSRDKSATLQEELLEMVKDLEA